MNQEPAAQERLDAVGGISGSLLAATSVGDLLQRIVRAAGDLTGARISVAGYDYFNGMFRLVAGARAEDHVTGQPVTTLSAECSAFLMGLLRDRLSFRFMHAELQRQPGWPGLPEGHPAPAGVLGARLSGHDGQPGGLLLVADKVVADFTHQDEAQLVQLAALASLALLYLEARGQADARSQELDRLYAQARFEQARWQAVVENTPDPVAVGPAPGAVATSSDITHLHETQERLEQANAALARARDELEGRVAERTAALAQRETLLAETNRALEQSRHELQLLSRGLVEMQEAERSAVARELHDGTGQLLTSLIVGLGILERRFAGSAEATAHIAYLKLTAQEVLEHIHRLGADLRPASLEKLGLGPALRQYAEHFAQKEGLEMQIELGGLGRSRLPQAVETAVYRIVQEALTNVARHAMAHNVGLISTYHDGLVTTIVEDDGLGFDPDNPDHEPRLGLLGMRQRAETLGGVLTVESTHGAGTTVFAEIPCCPPVPAQGSP